MVSDKVIPLSERLRTRPNIESSVRPIVLRFRGQPDKLTIDIEKLSPGRGDMITPVNDAHELHTAWAERFNAQDVDGMLALAEAESVFVPQPGVVTSGDDARGALEQFLGIGLPITMNPFT